MTNRIRLASSARLTCAALTLAGAAAFGSVAKADTAADAAMEPVWSHYWMAIAAANQCENWNFTGPQYDEMTHYINMRVNYAIGAGPRTHLIDDAKEAVRDRSFKYGCHDQMIGDLLATFHNELQPTLR